LDKTKEIVIDILKNIYDPEIPIDIYSMGLIYGINFENINDNKIKCIIDMTLTSPACPVAGSLVEEVKENVLKLENINEIKVKLTFDPPWSIDKVSDEGKEIMQMEGTQIPNM
jgi:metal-sulfur cluster biosynthetic enzyme